MKLSDGLGPCLQELQALRFAPPLFVATDSSVGLLDSRAKSTEQIFPPMQSELLYPSLDTLEA